MLYVCINCGKKIVDDSIFYRCPKCNDLLDIRYDYNKLKISIDNWETRDNSVWKYYELLPITNMKNIITLHEGGTPLYKCNNLEKDLNIKNLKIKNEGTNPTGSFKDRGMSVAISKVIEIKGRTVICASTGNTSASLAAYAAKAKLKCKIYIPQGKIATGKLVQAIIHGAEVIQLKGNFDDALQEILKKNHSENIIMNSLNPYRIEGQKTIGYEICSQLGYRSPDIIIIPVGNAGNITALHKGLLELKQLNFIDKLPRIIGVQAEGASPLVQAYQNKTVNLIKWRQPETIASAIRIGNPINWKRALKAVYETRGLFTKVSDEEIIEAQKKLARQEGIFVEPASATCIAYLKRGLDQGEIESENEVICITTGHGLKDPEIVLRNNRIC